MLWSIYEIFLTCLDLLFFLYIPTNQIGSKSWIKIFYVGVYGCAVVTIVTLLNNHAFFDINIAAFVLVALLIFSIVFLEGRLLNRILWVLIPYAIVALVDLFGSAFSSYVMDIPVNSLAQPGVPRLCFTLAVKAIQIGILIAFVRNKDLIASLKFRHVSFTILIPTAFMLVVLYASIYTTRWIDRKLVLITASVVIIMYIASLSLIFIIYKKSKVKFENEKLLMQIQSNRDLVLAFYDFRAQIIHHLQEVWILLKKQQVYELELYFDKLMQVNQSFAQLQKTNIDSLDVILLSKITKARLYRILLYIEYEPFFEREFDDLDVASILYHLLDEAIEIVDNLIQEDFIKTINCSIQKLNNELQVILKYPTYEESAKIKTSGESEIMQRIINRNNGKLHIMVNNFNKTAILAIPFRGKKHG